MKIPARFRKMGFKNAQEVEIALWALYAKNGTVTAVADAIGCAPSEISTMLGKTDHVFGYWLQYDPTFTTQERIMAHIREMYDAGKTPRDIAEACGFTPATIRTYLKKSGVRFRQGGANHVKRFIEHQGQIMSLAEYARKTGKNLKKLYYENYIKKAKTA